MILKIELINILPKSFQWVQLKKLMQSPQGLDSYKMELQN